MLFHLAHWLRAYLGDSAILFNVFRYVTFRAMAAFFLSFIFVLYFEPRFITWFRARYLGQPIRSDGPQSHLTKKGTPTMGGLVIVMSVCVSSLLLTDLTDPYVWAVLSVMVGYAILGFMDDYLKITGQNSKGVRARTKLLVQFLLAAVVVSLLVGCVDGYSASIGIPMLKRATFSLGWWFVPFGVLVVVGSSNAVNLTDGLDGLVIGPVMTCAFAYGIIAYVYGDVEHAERLHVTHLQGVGELSIVAAAIIAAGLGFLWFNSFPAQVFMGDVGALALGGALGTLSLVTKQELLLLVAGGVFVVEALSVIIQVGSFKLRGKRVLKMAPLHHHFELNGLAEPKIIVRCWIISIILAVLALSTLKLR